MKSLELVKSLKMTFSERSATDLGGAGGVLRFDHGDRYALIVRELAISREIQLSKSFTSFNYFGQGIERLGESGKSVENIKQFFEQGLLFREDDLHPKDKSEYSKLLREQCNELERLHPRIETFVRKRQVTTTSALDFSRLITRLCIGLAISDLTSAPLTASMRALRQRENVFYYHFHPVRHQRIDRVLKALYESMPDRKCSSPRWLLAQSLILMGYDPLVGTLCAKLTDNDSDGFANSPSKYCPVSFVSRICVADTTIGGCQFTAGDICYLSLVPPTDAMERQTPFPFGLGVHTCVGKRFSITVLKIAEEITRNCFPDGFDHPLKSGGDGAFLVFQPVH